MLNKLKQDWQKAMSEMITDPKELWTLLGLDPSLLEDAYAAARLFPLKVTRSFVARMEKGNINDPLLKQVLPLGAELKIANEFVPDPLRETAVNPVSGLLHKYPGRVLMTITSACAVHCRFCFRRAFPYAENNPGREGWEKIFSYVKQDSNIHEVILSGGDPLTVNDGLLKSFSDELSNIPHVKRLRFHTRLPVVLPQRITDEFLAWAKSLKLDLVIVLHVNHPQEINDEVKAVIQKLRDANVTLLNQAVLLKGVNDQVEILADLSETLFAIGVIPYYLHLLDKVQGSAHFDVDEATAKALHTALTNQLSGYLVPKLAREEPGELAKKIL